MKCKNIECENETTGKSKCIWLTPMESQSFKVNINDMYFDDEDDRDKVRSIFNTLKRNKTSEIIG